MTAKPKPPREIWALQIAGRTWAARESLQEAKDAMPLLNMFNRGAVIVRYVLAPAAPRPRRKRKKGER